MFYFLQCYLFLTFVFIITYNLKELFISNSDAVVMQEFSCWTLGFPDAHARLSIPEYVEIPVPESQAA